MQNSNLFLIFLCSWQVRCEYFTSTAGLKFLLENEEEITEILKEEMQSWKDTPGLDEVKNDINNWKKQNEIAMTDPKAYVENPIDAFNLIKRFNNELHKVETFLAKNPHMGRAIMETFQELTESTPTLDDQKGAVKALNRLQETYDLNMTLMVKGEIKGYKSKTQLTASDCIELGAAAYHPLSYRNKKQAYHWLKEAYNVFKQEDPKSVTEDNILNHLSYYAYAVGRYNEALYFTRKWLLIAPDHERAKKNHNDYKKLISGEYTEDRNEKDELDSDNVYENQRFRNLYTGLCRGDIILPKEVLSRLRCKYVHRNEPFLLIAPFKVEEMFRKPDILLFHDVINELEIELVKNLSEPELDRSVGATAKGNFPISTRISETTWLSNEDHPYVKSINQRAGDMTGLDVTTVEDLQVTNYGIGGQYDCHYDWTGWLGSNRTIRSDGHHALYRTATVMFYMSEVEQGGSTAFPLLKVAIRPQKGAAIVWYNFHSDSTGDLRTLHAACPVLIGSKWVANKWILNKGQTFARPCPKKRKLYKDFVHIDEILK